ncbi:MAG: S-adenosyl-l-methionine hydroxide adenosyltransferase family protein [Leptonema sp. (in: bacteria)]
MGIIYLITDFGNTDPYVGILKSRIYNLYSNAKIIDLTHNINPYDIESACWFLYYSFLNLEKDSIFCCVVDPGVGSERKPLLIEVQKRYFILPDNGIFTLVLEECKRKKLNYRIYEVDVEKLYKIYKKEYKKAYIFFYISHTFHGRDVFAPLAALVSKKKFKIAKVTKKIKNVKIIPIASPIEVDLDIVGKRSFYAKVVYVDGFGNLFTNLKILNYRSKKLSLTFKNKKEEEILKIHGLSTTFSDQKKGDFLFYVGSFGFLEIARNQDSAYDFFGSIEKIKQLDIILEILE